MKQVKIIGLKVNQNFGILESFNLEFNPENNLVAIKGEVGSGKTTFQKSLKLGTNGSETLKHDKLLYGDVNQEVQLLDGKHKIFIGCRTNGKGSLDYVIYTKDENGKKINDPVIDGMKVTPSSYLKSLQTSLTWRMNELTSENKTTQKNILLDLYQFELEKVGVIFDTGNPNYRDSILGQLDLAINNRTGKDVLRKRNGGLAGDLKTQGYDVDSPETLPKREDVSEIQKNITTLEFKKENVEQVARQERDKSLSEIKTKATNTVHSLKDYNYKVKEKNSTLNSELEKVKIKQEEEQKMMAEDDIHLNKYVSMGCLTEESRDEILNLINSNLKLTESIELTLGLEIPLSDGVIGEIQDISVYPQEIQNNINSVFSLRKEYAELSNSPLDIDVVKYDEEIQLLKLNLKSANELNKICDSIDSFEAWRISDALVQELRSKYVALLAQVNTGVEGLKISVDEKDEKLSVYLSYNGVYDKDYFNNSNLEYRKLSSYSGTQKPMICLLVQNYLLGRKEKAMRYIWIDDVPIDNKTKGLLEQMGKELDLTVFVNMTGDFDKSTISNGEILIEGGQVFFNLKEENNEQNKSMGF